MTPNPQPTRYCDYYGMLSYKDHLHDQRPHRPRRNEMSAERDELAGVAYGAMFPASREEPATWPPSLFLVADAIIAAGYRKAHPRDGSGEDGLEGTCGEGPYDQLCGQPVVDGECWVHGPVGP